MSDTIFTPLSFRSLTIKNPILRPDPLACHAESPARESMMAQVNSIFKPSKALVQEVIPK